jgi:hypothetical protein
MKVIASIRNYRIYIVVATVLAGIALVGCHEVKQIRFEPVAWKRADPIDKHWTVRSQMIEDLLRRYDFKGWTRPEVEQLLGRPYQGDISTTAFSDWDMFYSLGMERGGAFSLDQEVLAFKFDNNNKVIKWGPRVD